MRVMLLQIMPAAKIACTTVQGYSAQQQHTQKTFRTLVCKSTIPFQPLTDSVLAEGQWEFYENNPLW